MNEFHASKLARGWPLATAVCVVWAGVVCTSAGRPLCAKERQKTPPAERAPAPRIEAPEQPPTVVLSQRRTYHLDVARLDPLVDVTLARQWVFAQGFPAHLLAAIKRTDGLKTPAPAALNPDTLNPDLEAKTRPDSGYLRWSPPKPDRQAPSALLWFINGPKRQELVVSISRSFDHRLAKDRPAARHAFGPLRLGVDLEKARLADLRFGDIKLPQASEEAGVTVEDTVLVSVMGTLSDSTRAAIRAADGLLSEEISGRLSRLGYAPLSNESHHGISLGWLGFEHLRHELMLVVTQKAADFRYRISGEAIPLRLVRQQLHDAGWPLVLHGHEYLGLSEDGQHVLRPVEYVLSKRKAANKKPAK